MCPEEWANGADASLDEGASPLLMPCTPRELLGGFQQVTLEGHAMTNGLDKVHCLLAAVGAPLTDDGPVADRGNVVTDEHVMAGDRTWTMAESTLSQEASDPVLRHHHARSRQELCTRLRRRVAELVSVDAKAAQPAPVPDFEPRYGVLAFRKTPPSRHRLHRWHMMVVMRYALILCYTTLWRRARQRQASRRFLFRSW